jgi:hypothetical protein
MTPPGSGLKTRRLEQQYRAGIAQIARRILSTVGVQPDLEAWRQAVDERAQKRDVKMAAMKLAGHMVKSVDTRSARDWRAAARMGGGLKIYKLLQQSLPEGYEELVASSADYITSIPSKVAEHLVREIGTAHLDGARASTMEKMLRARLPKLVHSQTALIARTQTAKAAAALTESRAVSLGLDWYIWRTSEDSRVRESHANMDGVLCSYSDPPNPDHLAGIKSTLGSGQSGEFPNCFTGDTLVTPPADLERIYRAPFTGEVIDFYVGASRFTATPNHPILTTRGWLPAKFIQEGDELCKARFDALLTSEVNKNQCLTTFDDLFASQASAVFSKSGFAFNFYGDAPSGEVDIVTIDKNLPFDFNAGSFQSFSDDVLAAADCGIVGGSFSGFPLKVVESSTSSIGHQLTSTGDSFAAHAQFISLTHRARMSSVKNQSTADCVTSNVESFTELVLGKPFVKKSQQLIYGDVSAAFADMQAMCGKVKVTGRSVRSFTGHVYTLQTVSGVYNVTPEAIITHNCRCTQIVVLDLADIKFPRRVHYHGVIKVMTKPEFLTIWRRAA